MGTALAIAAGVLGAAVVLVVAVLAVMAGAFLWRLGRGLEGARL